MFVNTSFSSNESSPHSDLYTPTTSFLSNISCFISKPNPFIGFFIAFTFLIFPICIIIFYHGLQQWRQNRTSSSAATTSHSDCFTYHLVSMEMSGVSGAIICCYGLHMKNVNAVLLGTLLWSFSWYGETFFYILTCVEHYVAVLHPITYVKLRNERGIRNVIIGCVWLLCLVGMGSAILNRFIANIFILILAISVVSFCSLSVLCILMRPRPGQQGVGREGIDQTKQKAFYTITAMLVMLIVRFIVNLVWTFMYASETSGKCLIMASVVWFTLPSSLLLPLLFLHRAGKLVCWKKY